MDEILDHIMLTCGLSLATTHVASGLKITVLMKGLYSQHVEPFGSLTKLTQGNAILKVCFPSALFFHSLVGK